MLHAIAQHKTTHQRYYLGHRHEDGKPVRAEDEITSTFLGPLDFMESASVYRFWCAVLASVQRDEMLPDGLPLRHELRFWPSRDRIEPDAHIVFVWQNDVQIEIMVEFKWRASLSGKDQLHRQWEHYLTREQRERSWHVFIGLEISDGVTARDGELGNVWLVNGKERLVLLSWAQIRDVLSRCQTDFECVGLARWAKMAGQFLTKIGVRRFQGFTGLNDMLLGTATTYQSFFRGLTHGFQGFREIEEQLPEFQCDVQSFFKR